MGFLDALYMNIAAGLGHFIDVILNNLIYLVITGLGIVVLIFGIVYVFIEPSAGDVAKAVL